jgi:UDP-4-amino-4,6-dideoxy-N-acetyl-beta-L-altrosamine transaminase
MIPYGRQTIGEAEIAAVDRVMRSDFLTQGSIPKTFEKAVAQYCGADYAVAVANGTAALHLACLALGLGAGDYLWTSPNTFVASANCARHCGAEVNFVDIDPNTRNISIDALQQKLMKAEQEGCLPKVLVAVHFAGLPCDMAAIAELARRYQFVVIEDAAHAMGSTYRDERVGSCRYSDVTIFSFHPVKVMTTGEGGMITCNNKQITDRLYALRSHGITKDLSQFVGESEAPWFYEQQMLGFNYRLTDIQAAIGLVQLERLPEFIERRRYLVERYHHLLKALPVKTIHDDEFTASAWHIYVIEIDQVFDRRAVFDVMRDHGVGVHVHYIPVHYQPYYRAQGFNEGDFPVCENYYQHALTLPLYPDLTEQEQDKIVHHLQEALS